MRSNKGQLVSQHLEKIHRALLEEYQTLLTEHVKGKHGIYALYRKDNLHYVGLAKNLKRRLSQHLNDRHAGLWDKFSVYLTVNDSHMHELESLILRIVSPKGNKQSGKFINSKNLITKLNKEYEESTRKKAEKFGLKKVNEVIKPKTTIQEGRKNVLTPYVKQRFEIRFWYKGKLYKATVRKDGTILYKGNSYSSPSAAASAITKRAMNGWATWRYERAPGDWVVLDTLRKK